MEEARPRRPRFSGGFKTFSVKTSINREKQVESRLVVFSQGSRSKVLEYLWLKFLWDELSRLEYKLMLSSSILNSDVKFNVIKAINYQGKRKTRDRLEILFPDGSYSRERYQGFKRLDVEIYEILLSLPKTKKFSGWIRSSSAKGNKNSQGGSSFLETLTPPDYVYEEKQNFDWYLLLTVENLREVFPVNNSQSFPEED